MLIHSWYDKSQTFLAAHSLLHYDNNQKQILGKQWFFMVVSQDNTTISIKLQDTIQYDEDIKKETNTNPLLQHVTSLHNRKLV